MGKVKKTDEAGEGKARKVGSVGGRVAGLLVALGLMGVGAIFVIAGLTGDRPIAALIFGGLCELGGLALIISLIMSLFRQKAKQ